MEFFDAFMTFLKAIFNALTAFLGKSIPVISDLDTIETGDTGSEDGEG